MNYHWNWGIFFEPNPMGTGTYLDMLLSGLALPPRLALTSGQAQPSRPGPARASPRLVSPPHLRWAPLGQARPAIDMRPRMPRVCPSMPR